MFTFLTDDPCDLDLKSSESKTNKGHVLSKTNQHVKNKRYVINSSQDNEWKTFCLKSVPSDLGL